MLYNYCIVCKLLSSNKIILCKLLSSNYVFYVNYLQIRFLPVRVIFIIIIIFEYIDAPNLIPCFLHISIILKENCISLSHGTIDPRFIC